MSKKERYEKNLQALVRVTRMSRIQAEGLVSSLMLANAVLLAVEERAGMDPKEAMATGKGVNPRESLAVRTALAAAEDLLALAAEQAAKAGLDRLEVLSLEEAVAADVEVRAGMDPIKALVAAMEVGEGKDVTEAMAGQQGSFTEEEQQQAMKQSEALLDFRHKGKG